MSFQARVVERLRVLGYTSQHSRLLCGRSVPRYVALLRGVSPLNAKMPELKRCFEQAGFRNVTTVLASGNVVFDARAAKESALERKCEAAMRAQLKQGFHTIVRAQTALQELIEADPFAKFRLSGNFKRIVTFLRDAPATKITLPMEQDGARILAIRGRDVLGAYVPSPGDPAFMRLIEKTFGKSVTTRTWDTVKKCADA